MPYSLGADTKLPQIDPQLLQMGMKALQSGAIPIQTAMAAFHNSPYAVKAQGPANEGGQGPTDVPAAGPMTKSATDVENARVNAIIAAKQGAQAQANQQQVMAQNGPQQQQQPGLSVQPVVPGSGMKEALASDKSKKQTTTETKATLMDPADVSRADDHLQNMEAFKNLMAGQGDLENQLNMERDRKPGTDWRPLAALGDAWSGGHVADSLPKQENAQERAKRLFEAAQKIQGDRKSIVDTYFNNIKSLKGGALVDQLVQAEQLKHTLGAEDPNKGPDKQLKGLQAFQRGVIADTKEFRNSDSNLVEAQHLLANATSVADFTFRDKFLKALIGGRVTNYDLATQAGDKSIIDRADQWIETLKSGKLTDHNAAEYKAAIASIHAANQAEMRARIAYWRESGVNGLGFDAARVDGILNQHLTGTPASEQALQKTTAHTKKIVDHAQGNDMINVIDPQGRPGKAPKKNWAALKAKGFTVPK